MRLLAFSGFGFSFIVLDFPEYEAELGSRFLRYLAVSSLILRFFVIVLFLGSSSTKLLEAPSFSRSGSPSDEESELSNESSFLFFYLFSSLF